MSDAQLGDDDFNAQRRQAIRADIRSVADRLDHPPNTTEYTRHGSKSTETVYTLYDTWADALADAGLDPADSISTRTRLSPGYLVRDLHGVAAECGHIPSSQDYIDYSDHAPHSCYNHIAAGWTTVIHTVFGDEMEHGMEYDPATYDVDAIADRLDATEGGED